MGLRIDWSKREIFWINPMENKYTSCLTREVDSQGSAVKKKGCFCKNTRASEVDEIITTLADLLI